MAQRIQLRHDTAANWTTANPTLMVGEFGYETDTARCKIGDGSTTWTSLAYVPCPASLITGITAIANGGTGASTQQAAIDALTGTQSAGKYLRSDGTHATLDSIHAADVPTLNQNTTGTAAGFTGSLAGDATGTQGATVVGKLNGVSLAGLATGILKNTTATGLPSIAAAADFPTLNQSTTGNAATATAPAAGSAHGAATLDSSGHFQSVAPGSSGNVLQSNGTDWVSAAPSAATYRAPTVQKFTSGSGTYTTPTSPAPLYIRVRMVGGGGGGQGLSGAGGAGGNTTFGTSLLTANGGGAGGSSNSGTGGTASLGTGPTGVAQSGNAGGGGTGGGTAPLLGGGAGGASPFGGAGGVSLSASGSAGAANSGSGGGGYGGAAGNGSGGGGGSGGYVDAVISSPSATYAYAIGAGGTAGAGTQTGGAGGTGFIQVTEFYQ